MSAPLDQNAQGAAFNWARVQDRAVLARLHKEAMEGYYTSRLPTFYLEHYFWRAILEDSKSRTCIATYQGAPAGFAVYTADTWTLRKKIASKYMYSGFAFLCATSLFDRVVRVSTIANIAAMLKENNPHGLPSPELFLIAVSPQFRKKGIGYGLMQQQDIFFMEQGVPEAFLRLCSNNKQAMHIYSKAGFTTAFSFQEMGDDWTIMKKDYFERKQAASGLAGHTEPQPLANSS